MRGITAHILLAACAGCDGYEIVLGDLFWDYRDEKFKHQSFIRDKALAPLPSSHQLKQVFYHLVKSMILTCNGFRPPTF